MCDNCGKSHYKKDCPVYKDTQRRQIANRMKNIVEGDYFKKFGRHNSCTCRIEILVDKTLNESVCGAYVCYFCEWGCCEQAELKGSKICCSIHNSD